MKLFNRLSIPLLLLSFVAAKGDEPKPPLLPNVILHAEETPIAKAFERRITMDFIETPLQQVTEFLKDFTGIRFAIDHRGLERVGISPDEPITCRRNDVSFESAIDSILDPLRLTYIVTNGEFIITDAEGAAFPEARVYPLADLVFLSTDQKVSPVRLMAEQVKIIERSIDPDNWEEYGGKGTITIVPSSLSLVIYTSQPNHRRIARLLHDLRESAKATTTWLESKELSREDILSEEEPTKKSPPATHKPVTSPAVTK